MSNVIVRFPPSPTGYLHVGNARVALINWLFAKKHGGKIILRFDDTDEARTKAEFKAQMIEDLAWLGLVFDEFHEQSSRGSEYKKVFDALLEAGFIYGCYETEEELEMKRKVLLSRGKAPIYDRASLHWSEKEKEGRTPYFRFKLAHEEVKWSDLIQGEIRYHGRDLSDPVILRANGNFMYTFCSVVDDFAMNISHIIRGADHITNTAIQIQILRAIAKVSGKAESPVQFAHLSLFQSKEGKISKRVGGFSIMELRNAGFEAMAINNVLSKIGLSNFDDTIRSKAELIRDFNLEHFNKAQITFDFELIEKFNVKALGNYKYSDIYGRLAPAIPEKFFEGIKHNIKTLREVEEWFNIFTSKTLNFANLLEQNDAAFLSRLAKELSGLEAITWAETQKLLKAKFPERKGKSLFFPIRLALTGKQEGPEMHFIFENIKRELLLERLTSPRALA